MCIFEKSFRIHNGGQTINEEKYAKNKFIINVTVDFGHEVLWLL